MISKLKPIYFVYVLICITLCHSDNVDSETLTGLFEKQNCDVKDESCKQQVIEGNRINKGASEDSIEGTSISNGDEFNEDNPPFGHLKKFGEHAKLITDEISELPYMISGKEFYDNFIRKRKPIVFRNVTHDWKATQQWKNESYLLEKYSEVLFDVEMGKVYNQNLNPRKTIDFKEFLSVYRNKSIYLDSPFPQSEMMSDIQLPLMMQCKQLHEAFQSLHLLFSNGGTSSPIHVDGYENFLTVFSGKKVVYAASPEYIDDFYMQSGTDFPSLSPINPEAVDLLKFPKIKSTPIHQVVLEAGDMLYIPIGWFHQVRSFHSPNIATSMWFLTFSVDDVDINYKDMVDQENMFKAKIDLLPESIECEHQNVVLHSMKLLEVVTSNFTKETVTEEEILNVFVNETTLYEKVSAEEGTIFVGSDDTFIYAVDIETGDVRWKVKTAKDTGSTCAFSKDETLIYCGADDGYLRAIDIQNGRVVWQFRADEPIISSTCVDKNNNIYTASLDSFFYVLNPDGTLKWKKDLAAQIWSSPILYEEEQLVYIVTKRQRLSNIFAFDVNTGKTIWKDSLSGGATSTVRLSIKTNELFVATHYADVFRFNAETGESEKIMELSKTDGVTSSLAVDAENRFVYVLMDSGRLLSIEIDEKKIIWEIETGNNPKRDANSSPLLGPGNILYVGSSNGTVYAFNAADGHVLWKTTIGSNIFFTSPRLDVNGVLYIGSTDGPLYALYSETGEVKWSTKTDGPLVGTALITKNYL